MTLTSVKEISLYKFVCPQTSGGCVGSGAGGAGGSGGARGGSLRTPLARTPVTFNASQVASEYRYTLRLLPHVTIMSPKLNVTLLYRSYNWF